ncbi:hypothetical protein LWI29_020514 [Acer saccharum]|uniref:FHA domain-containing protein n=1 Tax=Acer saccharum TaxID=4024 RepID=A0AA39SUS1_ACESA|nr:hypothetical protein LWI29_020514 [Acer saccharum]
MYGRAGLDRFKKAQSLEPFSVAINPSSKPIIASPADPVPSLGQTQQVGGGQSNWQPPDWATEPRSGVYYLEVLKDGELLDRISLDRRRHIFGRQFQTCDFVLDHQSVSRQHAVVIPHKNGSIFVIDLGSAHGTFVANERLTKDTPVELEVGQSLRFAASTRTYILRKNIDALFPRHPPPMEINLPPPPDPSDEEAVVIYNTLLNRYGLSKSDLLSTSTEFGSFTGGSNYSQQSERAAKKMRKLRVSFRDQAGGELVEVVGFSDGADVETEPGPIGMKEGSLVGKYESLVQTTVIPKGKEKLSTGENNASPKGVTDRLKEVLNKVKSVPKIGTGIYDDLYGDSFSVKVGSSWACSAVNSATRSANSTKDDQGKDISMSSGKPGKNSSCNDKDSMSSGKPGKNSSSNDKDNEDDEDDLFGD